MAKEKKLSTKKLVSAKKDLLKVKKAKKSTKKNYLADLCIELEKASAGLTFPSEEDSSFEFFSIRRKNLSTNTDVLSPAEFLSGIGFSDNVLAKLNLTINQLIEERPFETFLPSIDDIAAFYGTDTNDPKVKKLSKRYRDLEKILRHNLGDVKVFRIGIIDIRCYIAGFVKGNNISGLLTTSIET